jgi:hypothetical protein
VSRKLRETSNCTRPCCADALRWKPIPADKALLSVPDDVSFKETVMAAWEGSTGGPSQGWRIISSCQRPLPAKQPLLIPAAYRRKPIFTPRDEVHFTAACAENIPRRFWVLSK